MKKAYLYGPRDLRIIEEPDPVPGPTDVVVRIRHSSLCSSDIKRYTGFDRSEGRQGIGHDAGGVIEAVGSEVTKVKPGDEVTLQGWMACDACKYCERGEILRCTARWKLAPEHFGWFSELSVVPEANAVPLLPGVSTEDGGLMEAAYTGINGRRVLGYGEGDLLVFFGSGWMTWGQIQVAVATGARCIVLARNPHRLEMSRRFGAIASFAPDDPDLADKIRDLNGGEDPFYVIDATGGQGPGALAEAQALTADGGIIGLMARKTGVALVEMLYKQQQIRAIGLGNDKPAAVEMVAAGKMDLKPCISHRFPFENLVEAFDLLTDKPDGVTKVMIEF